METREKLIGGVTGAELAELIKKCFEAFAEHVEKTGVDPLEQLYGD